MATTAAKKTTTKKLKESGEEMTNKSKTETVNKASVII